MRPRWRRAALIGALAALAMVGAFCANAASTPPMRTANAAREADWSRGTWAVEGGPFFSGYHSLAEMLASDFAPDNAAPLSTDYAQKAQQLRALGQKDPSSIDALARCLPFGTPLILAMPWPFKFQFSPGLVALLSESGFRKVYMDAAPAPESNEFTNTYYGHSTGWWDGDTLVIKSVDLRGDTVLEPGVPHSWQLQVVQRWRELDPNHLQNQITMTDPLALRRAWIVTKTYVRQPDSKLREKQCI